MAEYRSIRVEKGSGGFGGPLIITPTEKKNKVMFITGGGAEPEAAAQVALCGVLRGAGRGGGNRGRVRRGTAEAEDAVLLRVRAGEFGGRLRGVRHRGRGRKAADAGGAVRQKHGTDDDHDGRARGAELYTETATVERIPQPGVYGQAALCGL